MSPRDTVALTLRSVNWWTVAKVLLALLLPVFVAAGFDFKTPAKKFAEIEAKQETNSRRIDTLALGQQDTNKNFDVLFRLNCLDSHYSQRDLQLAGVNCPALLAQPTASQAGAPR